MRGKDRVAISEINCVTARKEANEKRKRELIEKKKKQKEEDIAEAKNNHILFSSTFKKEDWDAFIEKWYKMSAEAQAKKKVDQDEARDRREQKAAESHQKDMIELYSYTKKMSEGNDGLTYFAEREQNQMIPLKREAKWKVDPQTEQDERITHLKVKYKNLKRVDVHWRYLTQMNLVHTG